MDQALPSDSNLRPSEPSQGSEKSETEKDNAGGARDANAALEETKVIYHIDEEETPYKCTVRDYNVRYHEAFLVII